MPNAPSPEDLQWFELSLVLAASEAERLSDCLLEAGAVCVQAEDAQANTEDEQAIFAEPGLEDPHPRVWAQTRLTAYSNRARARPIIKRLRYLPMLAIKQGSP